MDLNLLILRQSWWLLALLILAAAPAPSIGAEEAKVSESDLKAAYLYNFTRFVDWPAKAFSAETDPLKIAVFDDEEFAKNLTVLLKDKKAHGRSFKVRNISSPSEAKGHHIVFAPKEKSRQVPQLIEALEGEPALTIGESPQFLNQGGVINFIFKDDQLRFEIHAGAADTAKLTISSRLMRLATNVRKGTAE